MKFNEAIMMMRFLTFCYKCEYASTHGKNPPVDMVESYVKWRFEQFCESNKIEHIEED